MICQRCFDKIPNDQIQEMLSEGESECALGTLNETPCGFCKEQIKENDLVIFINTGKAKISIGIDIIERQSELVIDNNDSNSHAGTMHQRCYDKMLRGESSH